jgi:lysozyme family protein
LAQGDPLNRRSVHEPSGRGPFKSWEEGAYDALVRLKKLNRVKDWRLEKMLYYAEQYNGWGYHYHRMPSPYLWGGTTIQRRGKYVADGRFSPTTWDVQPGVAALISQMMHLDPTISPLRES